MQRILCLLTAVFCLSAFGAGKPNIVFILADDLGYTDLACQGSKYYLSPNIDRMAQEGMSFTDAHTAAPNCAPTRAALMSGQYMPRTGIYTVGNVDRFDWRSQSLRSVPNVTDLSLEKIIWPKALKQGGYVTGMFGKWHLGKGEFHPGKRGFDEAIVTEGAHFNFETDPPQDVPKGTYLADWLTDKAVAFIRSHKSEPFLLYLPHFGVHAPHHAKPELIKKFQARTPVGGHKNPAYAAMIFSLDESVGRIRATLEELGLAQNTLVIFSSDNGGVGGYAREGLRDSITDNAPLRGGKGMLFEGGHRVPFIACWPGKIPAGTVCDQPIISMDIYPTMMEITGTARPANYILDGVSLAKLLSSGGKEPLNRDALYWHFPGYLGQGVGLWRTKPTGAIRSGDWKLLRRFEDNSLELYNLKDDIGETKNLASAKPDVAKRLNEKLSAWQKELGAPMPAPNKDRLPVGASLEKKAEKKKKKKKKVGD